MQAMTHIAMGALGAKLYKASAKSLPMPLPFVALLLILLVMVVSHVVLDDLAKATYHPPNALSDDWFWLLYHGLVLMISLTLLVYFRWAWLFIIAALLPDVDWFARFFGFSLQAHEWFRSLPIISEWSVQIRSFVPDWRYVPWAAAIEFGLLCLLLVWTQFLKPKKG